MDRKETRERNGKAKRSGPRIKARKQEAKVPKHSIEGDRSNYIDPRSIKRAALAKESAARVKKSAALTEDTFLLHTEQRGALQPENDLERTLHVRQAQIKQQVDIATAAKSTFSLDLASSNLSPYTTAVYSRSSRSLLVASRKGHVSICNWRNLTLQCELYLNESVRSATFLHNDSFFATAQKQHAFIYDSSGAQVHALRAHREPGAIVSLPHHLLLATVSAPNMPHSNIVYTDTSTGEQVASLNFGRRSLGLTAASTANVNPSNGIVHLAHNSGVVSLWSPVSGRPLARIFCHGGGVRKVAILPSGDAMVTAGADGVVKVTDLRTMRTRNSWRVPAVPTALAASQCSLIALSFSATVQVWALPGSSVARTAKLSRHTPYMSETFSGNRITGLDFCPFEDVMAVCHNDGMFSMIVPGAGESTFDSSAPNPYETRKQRRENEVRSLLDKLPPSSIALDAAFVGSVDPEPGERLREIQERENKANIERLRAKQNKKRAKGRNKISKRLKRRQSNIIDARRLELQQQLEQQNKTKILAKKIIQSEKAAVVAGTLAGPRDANDVPSALNRFFPKKHLVQ